MAAVHHQYLITRRIGNEQGSSYMCTNQCSSNHYLKTTMPLNFVSFPSFEDGTELIYKLFKQKKIQSEGLTTPKLKRIN